MDGNPKSNATTFEKPLFYYFKLNSTDKRSVATAREKNAQLLVAVSVMSVLELSTVTDNSPFQDYPHLDDHTIQLIIIIIIIIIITIIISIISIIIIIIIIIFIFIIVWHLVLTKMGKLKKTTWMAMEEDVFCRQPMQTDKNYRMIWTFHARHAWIRYFYALKID